ncbi:MAG: glycosyltransferase family 2 protein [Thermosulfidibacteraceae bacterium]
MKEGHKISIVIPVYNEEENIERVYNEIREVVEREKLNVEIILVNDGSTDNTEEILNRIAEKDKRVRVIHFRRNFGQTAAIMAGFEMAEGDIIITMDGDGQDDPNEIPRLLAKLEERYDIVSGWRKNRKDNFIKRVLPSRIANWIISTVTGVKLHDYGCSLKAYRRSIIENLILYGEQHRFIPAIASEIGAKVTEIPVNHRPRIAGKSKYGLSRIFKVIMDLIVIKFFLDYKTKPMRLFGGLGFIISSIGSIILLYLIYLKILKGESIGTRPLLTLSVLFILSGLHFITIGILLEVIIRTHYETKDKKPYIIKYTKNVQNE